MCRTRSNTARQIGYFIGAGLILFLAGASAQKTDDPFPQPIPASEGVIEVDVVEFATIPDVEGEPARQHTLVHEPGTNRLFLSDQRGLIYIVSGDGGTVTTWLDVRNPRWGVDVAAPWREMGVQSFAFHPQFAEPNTAGFGKFYVWTDTGNKAPNADFVPGGGDDTHDMIVLEFTARTPSANSYDGPVPREVVRFEQPYPNHNGGDLAFNPLARGSDPDFGMLYIGVGDGGSGGDPLDVSQDPQSAFGKVLRIDPLGTNSANGEYGIPSDNPFVDDNGTLDEIWLIGLRNPQHFAWDPKTGDFFVADIGQNTVEEVSRASGGDNLGWNTWEGSFRFTGSHVDLDNARGDAGMTYPVAEYDQQDALLMDRSAVTGLELVRSDKIPQLQDRLLFGDLPTGEIFHVDANDLPDGGQNAVRRVLLDNGSGKARTLLELVEEKRKTQGRSSAGRVDLRFGSAPGGRIFLLNKHDGVLRLLVPSAS